MFNPADCFEGGEPDSSDCSDRSQSPKPKRPVSKAIKTGSRNHFGVDFNVSLFEEEKHLQIREKKTLEEQEKFEETQKMVQEDRIKKIYKNMARKCKAGKKKEPKIKKGGRANKLNMKDKYRDKFLGKTNVYKTRYMRNGVAKKFYDDKYKRERDKLNMEADYRISIDELKKDQNLGRV